MAASSPLGRRRARPPAAVFGPVEQVAAAIAGPVSDAVDSVGNLGDGQDERSTGCSSRTHALQPQLRTGDYDRSRAQELDDLLTLAGPGATRSCPRR